MADSFSQLKLPHATLSSEERVDNPSNAYLKMQSEGWDLYHDLLAGTEAMRAAGEKWLPKEPNESHNLYKVRKDRTFLHNAFKDTIRNLISKPFSRKIEVEGEDALPDMVKTMLEDFDGASCKITQFARDTFKSALTYGVVHALVDFPTTEQPPNKPADSEGKEEEGDDSQTSLGQNDPAPKPLPSRKLSKAQEAALKLHPVVSIVSAPNLLGWKTEKDGTQTVLSEIRIKEVKDESVKPYGEKEVEYVRVYTRTNWELWRKSTEGSSVDAPYELFDSGTHTFGEVPLVTMYFNKTGHLTGESPLDTLAWLNLSHWQSQSDYRNGIRYITHSLLFQKGVSKAELRDKLSVGPAALVRTSSEQADMKYVEHAGTGMGTAWEYLLAIKEDMESLGMKPLLTRSGDATATAAAIDEARASTDIQMWVKAAEDFLEEILLTAWKWVEPNSPPSELPDDVRVDINNDFGVNLKSAEDLTALQTARGTGDLSRKTFLIELKRRGVLHEQLDIENEIESVDAEGPSSEDLMNEAKMNALKDPNNETGVDEVDEADDPKNESIKPDGKKPKPF